MIHHLSTRTVLSGYLAMAAIMATPAGAFAATPSHKANYAVPAELGSVCTDTGKLAATLAGKLHPQPPALDQWTNLLRTLTCDLTGKSDLGWRRVRVRSYTAALTYPLTWIDYQTRSGKERRILRRYYSREQVPQKLEFWLGGHIDEVEYDARRHTLAARFPAARQPQDPPGMQCRGTRLSFRQQEGSWFLSGVEALPKLTCRVG